jgi:hypothetical protein
MGANGDRVRAGRLITRSLRDVSRPPYAVLVALSLFIYVVSFSVSQAADDVSLLFTLLLAAVSAYVQIACTLAAATPEPATSADAWLVAALRRRCLWRFLLAEVAAILLIVVGLVALVVGGFVVGGIVALAQPAAVLERKGPIEAIRRSAELGRPARAALAVVFGALVLAPGMALQIAYETGAQEALGPSFLVAGALGVVLMMAGTIALARAFTMLGGDRAPVS